MLGTRLNIDLSSSSSSKSVCAAGQLNGVSKPSGFKPKVARSRSRMAVLASFPNCEKDAHVSCYGPLRAPCCWNSHSPGTTHSICGCLPVTRPDRRRDKMARRGARRRSRHERSAWLYHGWMLGVSAFVCWSQPRARRSCRHEGSPSSS